ncbi:MULTISPECIES: hypothetical protein [unclassified Streptomyces]|uniref:hypothetical protein n=1 Tax=unclassified Streptomyces TaxID=2593676 RepID=UPI00131BC14E|nr:MULTISPECIES: hypothetical protein [unclassified Streptomyces]
MNTKRIGGAFAVALAAASLPILAASPASADQGDCQYYLHEAGYNVGPKVESACRSGANQWNPGRWVICYSELITIGVREGDASAACFKA